MPLYFKQPFYFSLKTPAFSLMYLYKKCSFCFIHGHSGFLLIFENEIDGLISYFLCSERCSYTNHLDLQTLKSAEQKRHSKFRNEIWMHHVTWQQIPDILLNMIMCTVLCRFMNESYYSVGFV